MINGSKDDKTAIIKPLLVWVMVLAFILPAAADLLHSHHHPDHTEWQDGFSVSTLKVKCQVCDYFVHHQPVYTASASSFQLNPIEIQLTTRHGHYADQLLQLSGLGLTNKGPPSVV